MAVGTLALAGTLHLVASASFAYVAHRVARRAGDGDGRWAQRGFLAWWRAMSGYLAIQAGLTYLAAAGETPLGLHLALRVVTIPLLCIATWGLVTHFLYVLTGRVAVVPWTAAAYAVVMVAFFVASASPLPQGVEVGAWFVQLEGTGEGLLYRLVYLAVGLPTIAASVGYLAVGRRVDDPAARRRIRLVGSGILTWVGSGLVAFLGGSDLVRFFTLTVLGIGASLLVLAAYAPPSQERAAARQARDEGIRRRARDLV